MALSRGFFCQSRQPHPRIEHVEYIGVIKIEMRQHDQSVKPQVSHLINQCIRGASLCHIFGRENDFGRLLTNFFKNFIQPVVVQRCDIRFLW